MYRDFVLAYAAPAERGLNKPVLSLKNGELHELALSILRLNCQREMPRDLHPPL